MSKFEKWKKLSQDQRGKMIREMKVELLKSSCKISKKGLKSIQENIDVLTNMNIMERVDKYVQKRSRMVNYWDSFTN